MARFSAAYLERVAREWQNAFTAAHNKPAPAVTWEKGWFTIEGAVQKYRRAALERMTKTLRKGFDD